MDYINPLLCSNLFFTYSCHGMRNVLHAYDCDGSMRIQILLMYGPKCVKVGLYHICYFLFHLLFSISIDDLINQLETSYVGCSINVI